MITPTSRCQTIFENDRLGLGSICRLPFVLSLLLCLSIAPASASASKNKYEKFLLAHDSQDFYKANILINEVVALNKDDEYYLAERARNNMQLNKLQDALNDSTKAISINPKNSDALRTRSYCYFMRKDYEKGLADLNSALKYDKPNPVNLFPRGDYENRARAYTLMGKRDLAQKEQGMVRVDRLMNQACDAREGAGLDKAIKLIDQYIAVDPKCVKAHLFKAVCLNNLTQFSQAIDSLNKVLALSPDTPCALYLRADGYRETKKPEKAIADYTRIIELKPHLVMFKYAAHTGRLRDKFTYTDKEPINLADIYFLRAGCYASLKQNELAAKDYGKVLELDPKEYKAAQSRGLIMRNMKKYDEAVKDFTLALTINPRYLDAYQARSRAYEDMQQLDKAIADLTSVVSAQKNDAGAYMLRAQLFERLKQYPKAIDDFSKVIAIAPGDDDAFKSRGDLYLKVGEYKNAISDYDTALKLGSEDKENINKSRSQALKLMGR